MKRLMLTILGSMATAAVCYFVVINIIQILILGNNSITFDFGVLFYQGNSKLFWLTTIFVATMIFGIISSEFMTNEKKKHADDDKKNYSHLASVYEAKRGLVRIQFKDGKLAENTFLDTMDRVMNGFKKGYNGILYFFKIPDRYKMNVLKTYMIDGEETCKRAGMPIYTPRFFKNRIYVDPSDSHNLIIGTTRSGKTFYKLLIMIAIIRMCHENAVFNDPKGELYKYTADDFEKEGYEVIRLDYTNPDISDDLNPLSIAWERWVEAEEKYKEEHAQWRKELDSKEGEEISMHMRMEPELDHSDAIGYLKDIASILTYEENDKDMFWNDSAAMALVGLAAFLMEEGKEEYINFKSINMLKEDGTILLTKEEKKALKCKSISRLGAYIEKNRKPDDYSRVYLNDFLNSSEATMKSIKSVLSSKISILTSNEKIMKMTSRNSFDLKNLGRKKMVIYLVVHDEKSTYYPLVTLFMKQMYETLIEKVRNDNTGRLRIPINVVIDEAGNCPAFMDISTMLTASAARGFRFTLAFQDFSQIHERYGNDVAKTIINNCTNIVYVLGSQEDTLKQISEMCGHYQVWLPARKMYESRPLISPDRLRKMNESEAVFIRQRKNAFMTRMLPYNKYKQLYHEGTEYCREPIKKPKADYYDFDKAFDEMMKTATEE